MKKKVLIIILIVMLVLSSVLILRINNKNSIESPKRDISIHIINTQQEQAGTQYTILMKNTSGLLINQNNVYISYPIIKGDNIIINKYKVETTGNKLNIIPDEEVMLTVFMPYQEHQITDNLSYEIKGYFNEVSELNHFEQSGSLENLNTKPTELRIGYITYDKDNNSFFLDEIEWVTTENTERIQTLGLTTDDLPDGYYINNPTVEKIPLNVNEETTYEFIDWNGFYVVEDEDKKYTTNNKEEFITNLNSYSGEKVQPLFWIEIKDNIVIKIKEQLIL